MNNDKQNQQNQTKIPVRLPVIELNEKSYFVDRRLKQYRNVENPHDFIEFDKDPVVFRYTRVQALEDGQLVDLSGPAGEAGFKLPVAITCGVESLLNDTEQAGQSFQGRAWDMLMVLRHEIRRTGHTDTVHFAPLFNTRYHADPKAYKLWAKCGPGDNGEPVITIMLHDED